jgi:hypothetical protein
VIVFIDQNMPCLPNRNWRWATVCHLTSDDLHDLHAFARKLGLKRQWFQWKPKGCPHYDLTPSKREQALTLGAIELDRFDFVTLIREWRGHYGAERLPSPHRTRLAEARAAFELALRAKGPETVKAQLELLDELGECQTVADARQFGVGASGSLCGGAP